MERRAVPFETLAGAAAIAAGVGGVAYSAAFVTFLHSGSSTAAKISSLLLAGGGLVVMPMLVGLYGRLRSLQPGLALVGLVLGLVGAAGATIHGAYDLANFIKPPGVSTGNLPNAVDPRGVLTFAFSGLSILVAAWLIVQGRLLPKGLAYLGLASGALLIYVYLGRLIILNPKSPSLMAAAVVSGFVVNPAWAIWVGVELLRRAEPARVSGPAG